MTDGSVRHNGRAAFAYLHSQAPSAVTWELDREPLIYLAWRGREDDHLVLSPLLNCHFFPYPEVSLYWLRQQKARVFPTSQNRHSGNSIADTQ